MVDNIVIAVPEQGQLVEVRQRKYVVTDVVAGAPLSTPGYPGNGTHHLVSLTSVAERPNAVPVGLMNGRQLVALLVENDIGVKRASYDLVELVDEAQDSAQG